VDRKKAKDVNKSEEDGGNSKRGRHKDGRKNLRRVRTKRMVPSVKSQKKKKRGTYGQKHRGSHKTISWLSECRKKEGGRRGPPSGSFG